jgi:hypothetical protein
MELSYIKLSIVLFLLIFGVDIIRFL